MQKIIEVIRRERWGLLGDLIGWLSFAVGIYVLLVLAAAFQTPIN